MAFVLMIVLAVPAAGEEVTVSSLLEEMIDLQGLARLPEIPYVARQASSYDRASTSPEDEKGWFANRDAGQFLRVEETEDGGERYVMMDVDGPGAVTRIWSANPKGTIRIHIDGKVALEAPMTSLLRGKHDPFVSPFAYEASRGCNIYFPFPYEKSCKITSDEGGFYYQIGYRTYPAGTTVEAFQPAVLEAIRPALDRVRMGLMDPEKARIPHPDAQTVALDLEPGTLRELKTPAGGGVAHTLTLRAGITVPEIMRRCVLSIRFDGVETVRAPLGDFFGTGPAVNRYESLPFGVGDDETFTCRWLMPFQEKMEIGIEGEGLGKVVGSVVVEPFPWDDRTMHFHAAWRAEYDIPTNPPRDWNYISVTGQGVYVGNLLNVANPVRTWWGEGDEKIYVDGETFPSHFGTGTEDYYGYAWGCPTPFTRPYHNQTRCDGPVTYGHTSLNRWHIIDAIPFQKDLRFDMEVWHHRREIRVSYETVNYWYALPGGKDNRPSLDPTDLRIAEIPELKVKVISGAIEGETLKPQVTAGQAGPQGMGGYGEGKWSRETQLWWRGAKPGDKMQLPFRAPRAGRFHVIAYVTKAPDYGICRITIGEAEEGTEVDLWAEGVVAADPIDLGVHDLGRMGNEMRVEIVGTNEKASPKNHMFGLDCIVLKPVEGGGK